MDEKRRRRRYTKDFKRRVVAETLEPGASVASVALRHGLNANVLFNWRRDPRFRQGNDPGAFLPVEVSDPIVRDLAVSEPQRSHSRVEIALRSGHRLILSGPFDPEMVLRLARGLAQA